MKTMKKLMNLLGLLLLSLTISLSTTSCGDKDDKKDNKEENNKSNENSGNENSGNENSGNENSDLMNTCVSGMYTAMGMLDGEIPAEVVEMAECMCAGIVAAYPNATSFEELDEVMTNDLELQMKIQKDCMPTMP